jgi:4-hydroxy-tetrahydrodipicolinate reductase
MIRVLVNGAAGKMGRLARESIGQDPELDLVGGTGRGDDLATAIIDKRADVVVDLTTVDSGYRNAVTILEVGARPVIGTSGFTSEQVRELQVLAGRKQLGGVVAPNFSIGAVFLMEVAKQAVRYFPAVEIIESHHEGKLDAPSGTAIRTAEIIAEARDGLSESSSPARPERELITGARGARHAGVRIHSVRLPGHCAHQEVVFGGFGERLVIRHDTLDRNAFMPGICLACKKVMGMTELVFGLEKLL